MQYESPNHFRQVQSGGVQALLAAERLTIRPEQHICPYAVPCIICTLHVQMRMRNSLCICRGATYHMFNPLFWELRRLHAVDSLATLNPVEELQTPSEPQTPSELQTSSEL